MKILVVGLGNPNMEFTRHNVGADTLKLLINNYVTQIDHNLYQLNENLLFYLQPDSMNISGDNINKTYDKHECTHLIVVVDELDLAFGHVKKTFSKGSRGHNGIKSVLEHFPEEIWQVLVGIGRPHDNDVSSFVLGKFTNEEKTELPHVAYKVGEMIFEILSHIKNSFEV